MKQAVDPKVAIGVAGALVVLIVAGLFMMNRGGGGAPVDVSHYTKDQLGDPSPIHPGQPGYKAYTTDPDPAPGSAAAAPAKAGGKGRD